MGRFDRNSSRRPSGRDSGRRAEMFPAVCDKCGKDCQVPFRPSGDKPIYCSNCFEKQGGGSSDRFERRDDSRRSFGGSRDRGDRGNKEMFSAVCDDCGKDCQVPFNPSSDKPIYCSKCFENRGNTHDGNSSGGGNNKQSEQLELIIRKLDQVIAALESKCEPCNCEPKAEKKETVKKEVVKKAKKEVVKKTKAVKKAKKE